MTHAATPQESKAERILTWRSVLFGTLGIFIMSGLASYHDDILGGTYMVGNHMPGGAFTYMIFLGLFWNGFWKLLDSLFKTGGGLTRAMALSTRELVVVMVVTLVACFPPTSGLGRYFHRMIMLPWYYLQNKVTWGTHGLLSEYMNHRLFPTPWPGAGTESEGYDLIYRGFFTGLASGSELLSIRDLWDRGIIGAWARPMSIWGPLLILLSIAIISLQYLVHRQWAKHEQLGYPVAQVAASFCKISGPTKGVPDIFRNPLFWCGFVPVLSLLLVMYLAAWYPQQVPTLAQMFPAFKSWSLPLTTYIPILKKAPDVWPFSSQTIYFTIIGLAYFVSSEISITMGLSMIMQVLFCVGFFVATGEMVDSGWMGASRSGAYIGYSAILIYTGRNYFSTVFGKALGFNRRPRSEGVSEDDEAVSITAARVLLAAFIGFTMVLAWCCQSWLMAIFYSLATMVMYLVLSRIVCESGIPFIQAAWTPGAIILRLIGPAAAGPHALNFMLYSSGILTQDPRECLMPYVATGAKMADDNGVRLKKLYWIVIGSVILALVVAWFSCTYSYYNYNPMSNTFAAQNPPTTYLDTSAQQFQQMKLSGVFEKSLEASPLGRLKMVSAVKMDLRFFIAGFAAVMLFSLIRFRFSKFPIHPILFLVAGTYPCMLSWSSFLLGWFIKTLVVRFGGGGVYQKLKPLFIGLIAAELFMVGMMVLIDFVYFGIYGAKPPVTINIMPG